MKIKTFNQDIYESNEQLDSRVNHFLESVRVLNIMADSTTGGSSNYLVPRSSVTVVYEEQNHFSDSLVFFTY